VNIFVDVDDPIGRSFGTKARSLFRIEPCFVGFVPKLDVSIDDQAFSDWHHLRQVYPSSIKDLLGDFHRLNNLS
jgi:hypothetical protein